jgi:hypothetical protein
MGVDRARTRFPLRACAGLFVPVTDRSRHAYPILLSGILPGLNRSSARNPAWATRSWLLETLALQPKIVNKL